MIFRFFKKLDKANKLYFQNSIIEKFGKEFYLEIYNDKLVLIPVKKGK